MTRVVCPVSAIEAVVAELDSIMPAGTVIAVVVEIPGHPNYRVGAPCHQNPAATYGMLREVTLQRGDQSSLLG